MTDYIDYLTADEKPNAKLMIQRLSEAGKCIISGETDDLVEMPVDMNPDNVLANNMACITKALARESLYTSFYTVTVKDFEVTFCTAPVFQNYNIELCGLLDKDVSPEAAEALKMDGYDFTKIYAYLTARHCKGITRVLVPDKVGSYMEWNQYLGFVMRSRIRMKASGIIKPPTLVSV
jgi:hypothetical protein